MGQICKAPRGGMVRKRLKVGEGVGAVRWRGGWKSLSASDSAGLCLSPKLGRLRR